jgi:hypothetical protein
MNNPSIPSTSVVQLPVVLTPSPRIMRQEGQTHDRYHMGNGRSVVRELTTGETSLDWTPRILPLFSFPFDAPHGEVPVPAGSAVAIVRDGYAATPLGIATDMYRPVSHQATVVSVAESTMGKCSLEGALIDGHGYHVVHAFRVNTLVSEMIGDLPMISRMTIVHDHTGMGSLRASVVCYLGRDVVIGSRNFTRRIHVGRGAQDVGVDSGANWTGVIDAMLETAALQQGFLAETLRVAAQIKMTEEHAIIFERAGVHIERTKVSDQDKARAAARGESMPVPQIVPATALDVVIAHHKQRSGRLSWGVWSRRLEGSALGCLETITGVKLPAQLFRRES